MTSELKRGNAELRRADAILRSASASFGVELDRPQRKSCTTSTSTSERHEDADGQGLRWGVEPICAGLTELGIRIASATDYEHRGRQLTAREQRDEDLKAKVAAAHASNYGVDGD